MAASDLPLSTSSPPENGPVPLSTGLDVLLVAYHSGGVLARCLEEIAGFVPAGTRILVIDNSPEDPSAAEAVARTQGAELLPQARNVGFAAAVNAGLRHGNGELALLVNPDIVGIEGSFEHIRELFARVPDAGSVTVQIRNDDGVLAHCRRRPRRLDFFDASIGLRRFLPRRLANPIIPMLEWDHEDERAVDDATGAFLFLRRAAVEDVGYLDERFFMYWEETDWLARARARGWRLLYTPEVRAVHAGRQGSEVGSTTHSLLFLESGYEFVRKHHGPGMEVLLRLSWILADSARLVRGRRRPVAYREEVRERLLLHLGLKRAH